MAQSLDHLTENMPKCKTLDDLTTDDVKALWNMLTAAPQSPRGRAVALAVADQYQH